MGLKEDQEFSRTACERLIIGFPAKLLKKESAIADRLSQVKLSPLKKLEAVYELLGEIGAHIAPSTPCKKGCSSCCHYGVTVSEIEVQYIEARTKHKRLKQMLPNEDFHGQACPFLKENSCSIYLARPFVCRRHHSLAPTPEWCAPDKSAAGDFTRLESSELKNAFDALRVGSPVWDIRQVFRAQ